MLGFQNRKTGVKVESMAVAVVAAGVWTSPSAVRPVDGPALERPARVRDWAAAQGPTERRQLWGVLDTQVLLGDVVLIDEIVEVPPAGSADGGEADRTAADGVSRAGRPDWSGEAGRPGETAADGVSRAGRSGMAEAGGTAERWARVVVLSQPSRRDPRGYPGWIPLSQLDTPAEPADTSVVVTVPVTDLRTDPGGGVALADVSFATVLPAGRRQDGWIEVNLPGGSRAWVSEVDTEAYRRGGPYPKPEQVIEAGRQFAGLMYLAGGCHGLALDCSSLVHLIYRRFGHVTPRDAADEAGIGDEVAIDDLEPGDLLFFAKPDTGFIYHCGICVGMPSMLHVSQTDWACLDGPMTDLRRSHLIGGRRLR